MKESVLKKKNSRMKIATFMWPLQQTEYKAV